jgi:hypothetical protein
VHQDGFYSQGTDDFLQNSFTNLAHPKPIVKQTLSALRLSRLQHIFTTAISHQTKVIKWSKNVTISGSTSRVLSRIITLLKFTLNAFIISLPYKVECSTVVGEHGATKAQIELR